MDLENLPEKTNQPNILVTGVPGSGKTTFCQLLASEVNNLINQNLNMQTFQSYFQHLNVGEEIANNQLYTNWDNDNNCSIFDADLVVDHLEPFLQKGGCVVDFHSSGDFPERWFDLVIQLRCNNTQLYDRLKARGYAEDKIRNNVECEILETISEEVYEAWDKNIVLQLRNEKESDMNENLEVVFSRLQNFKILDVVKGLLQG